MRHIPAKYKKASLLVVLGCSLLLAACGGAAPESAAAPAPTDTLVVETMPEVTNTPVPTETPTPTPESTPTEEGVFVYPTVSTLTRECNSLGAYSIEIPKVNYSYKDEGNLSQIYRLDDYVVVRLERKTNADQETLSELLETELEMIENDMDYYVVGDVVELTLPAGDALAVDFSGSLLTGIDLSGQLTVIAIQDGTYLAVIGFGKFDGPNDVWQQDAQPMHNHLLESLEIYPQDGEACTTTTADSN